MAFGTIRLAFLRRTELAAAILEWKTWPDLTIVSTAFDPRNPDKLLIPSEVTCKLHIIFTILFLFPDPLN